MTDEYRNLTDESVDATCDEKRYCLFNVSWLLIIGLILINIGCFVKSNLLDNIFRLLDIRLWKWWYFLFLALLIAFSVQCFFIERNRENDDKLDIESAKRFNRMAITTTIVMAVLVLLNMTRMLSVLYYPLLDWFTRGVFSEMALLSFTLVLFALIPIIYFFKEWVITFWK
ncbi:MAG: hypothetical protein LBJ67_14580 [Planctomycetaceae bacterium]|jgi:hypothetical protein|nr:hypothetical protein [Planctomycetaceae bacterium]